MSRIIINRERVIDRARWIAKQRVPFVHQGRTLQGIDCIGTAAWILEYGEEMPAYPRDPVQGELETNLERVMGRPILTYTSINRMKTIADLQPCDIVSIQYKGPIRHIGIVIPYIDQRDQPGALSLVHCDSDVGCTAEVYLDDFWMRRTMKV